jgi:hypothetical protein
LHHGHDPDNLTARHVQFLSQIPTPKPRRNGWGFFVSLGRPRDQSSFLGSTFDIYHGFGWQGRHHPG